MTILQLALQLNTDTDSAFQFAETMVQLRMANRTDPAGRLTSPSYTFFAPIESFAALVAGLSRQGARA